MQITINLPWPDKNLSPNSRPHWALLARLKKRYRLVARAAMRSALTTNQPLFDKPQLTICFHPPDRRKRDQDNMLSSIKSGLDGIADALGIDDVNFSISFSRGDPSPPQGKVVITLHSSYGP